MMKTLLAFAIASLAACGGGTHKPPNKPDPNPHPAPGMIACTSEIALACPEDTTDGCLAGTTSFHVCVAQAETAGPSCAEEIAKVCGEGQIDACLATPAYADRHVCVYAPATPAPSAADSCPTGEGYYSPGCDGNAIAAEGCYASCANRAACGDGATCKT